MPGHSLKTGAVPVKTGRLVNVSVERYMYMQISARLSPKTKATVLRRLSFRMGSFAKACLQPLV